MAQYNQVYFIMLNQFFNILETMDSDYRSCFNLTELVYRRDKIRGANLRQKAQYSL